MFWEQNSVTLENQRHLRKPLKKVNKNGPTRRTNAEWELPITNEYERTLGLNGNLQFTNTRQENQHKLNLETPSAS